MIVIDASALTKYILKEKNWIRIANFLKEGVVSIDHVVKEVSNAIWKHCILLKIINKETATKLLELLENFIKYKVLILEPELNYLNEAFKIALNEEVTIYDALYLALAKKHGEILTSDKKQAKIAEKIGIKVSLIE